MTKVAVPTRKSLRIDEADSSTTYIGESAFGSSEAAAVWRIYRLTVSGTVTTLSWADGNDEFDNIWNNRASLSYS